MRNERALGTARRTGVLVLPASQREGPAVAAWLMDCAVADRPVIVCYVRQATAEVTGHPPINSGRWQANANAERWSIATQTVDQICGQYLRHRRGSHRRTFVRLMPNRLILDGIWTDNLAAALHTIRAAVYDWSNRPCPTEEITL